MRFRAQLALFTPAGLATFLACGGISTSTDPAPESRQDNASGCAAVCERALGCPGFNDGCVDDCVTLTHDSDQAGCGTARDAYLGCLERSADFCQALTRGCSAEASGYSVCMFDYCRANPSSKACSGSF